MKKKTRNGGQPHLESIEAGLSRVASLLTKIRQRQDTPNSPLDTVDNNLGMVLRLRFGAGTPRQAMVAFLFVIPESQAGSSAIQPCLVMVMIATEARWGNFVV